MLSGGTAPATLRRAGVVGHPIDHSLSPLLHRAAYEALGLRQWSYGAVDVPAGELAGYVASLGPEWTGLSVTMPGKEEALALAVGLGEAALLTGAANTLVRREEGWWADNTDVHGLTAALAEAGLRSPATAVVLGGGATARSALVALTALGVTAVDVRVRDDLRPQTAALLERLGPTATVRRLSEAPVVLDRAVADVVISTLPVSATPPVVLGAADPPVVLDVVYAPWPSPFARAVVDAGEGRVPVVRGTAMLLHQAVRQVELTTGHDGPVEAMRAALVEHLAAVA
ncbi:shikimate dehydrogenase [Ornithinimicrobium sp. LYQ121]|uniref:shikimate dehydrogenase n=1 Tax=Ornithinimicrobium sp. LYQ121 TaxID=3378801 RepID=UPI0038541547